MDATTSHLSTPQLHRIHLSGGSDTTPSYPTNVVPARGETTFRRTIGGGETLSHARNPSDLTASNFLRPNCATTMSTSLPFLPKPNAASAYYGSTRVGDSYYREAPPIMTTYASTRDIYHRDAIPTTTTTVLSEYETHISHPPQESSATLPVSSNYYEQPGVPQVSTTVYKADARGRWTVQEIPGGFNVPAVLTSSIPKQPVSSSIQHSAGATTTTSVAPNRSTQASVGSSQSGGLQYSSNPTIPSTVTLGSIGQSSRPSSSRPTTTIYSTSTLTQDPRPVVSREDTFVNGGDSTKPSITSSLWSSPPSIKLTDRSNPLPSVADVDYSSSVIHTRGASSYPIDATKSMLLSRSDLSESATTFDMQQNGQYAAASLSYSQELTSLKREVEKARMQIEHTTKTLDVLCDVLAAWLKGLPSKDARLLVNDLLSLLGGHCQPDSPEFEAVRARLDLCSRML